jgi:ABC-type uncharacterized transport system ATPase subunit
VNASRATLEISHLTRSITANGKRKTIVNDVSYSFGCGTVYSVVGPSGAGKSSLLRLMNRLDEPGVPDETLAELLTLVGLPAATVQSDVDMLSGGEKQRVAMARLLATAGMVSILNFMKTVGIVALPGAMTGMILAGKPPLEAALFQLIIGYMLMSAVTLTVVMTLELVVRRFFTPFDQFRPPVRD